MDEGTPPARRENAFDQLVLPPGHKDMVKSLITQHFQDKESADAGSTDIVRGKGGISFELSTIWVTSGEKPWG